MNGKLYGIGAGPGDPELLTLKAVRAIRRCAVIATPAAGDRSSTVFEIVRPYLDGKERLLCRFDMCRDPADGAASKQKAADDIIRFLREGKDVGFVTLGDPGTYSTFSSIRARVRAAGFETVTIPGITSYAAAAAALDMMLCDGGDMLQIVPAGDGRPLEDVLAAPGTKVLMKSGRQLRSLLTALKEGGYEARTSVACRVSMPDEKLYRGIDEFLASGEETYFSLVIVKSEWNDG